MAEFKAYCAVNPIDEFHLLEWDDGSGRLEVQCARPGFAVVSAVLSPKDEARLLRKLQARAARRKARRVR